MEFIQSAGDCSKEWSSSPEFELAGEQMASAQAYSMKVSQAILLSQQVPELEGLNT